MVTQIKVYACYIVKIYKNKPQFFFKPGARARRAGPGSAFVNAYVELTAYNLCQLSLLFLHIVVILYELKYLNFAIIPDLVIISTIAVFFVVFLSS